MSWCCKPPPVRVWSSGDDPGVGVGAGVDVMAAPLAGVASDPGVLTGVAGDDACVWLAAATGVGVAVGVGAGRSVGRERGAAVTTGAQVGSGAGVTGGQIAGVW